MENYTTEEQFGTAPEETPKFIMPEFDSPKNFPEDYPGENGKYICKCFKCKDNFFGYKRRVICKACQESETSKEVLQVENNIDINKLSTKELFHLIENLNKNFTVVKGWGLIKNKSIDNFNEGSYIIECGKGEDYESIENFFEEFEYEVEDGFYEFRFLLSYSPAQIGSYPPPNIECEAYYDYLDSIFEMKASIEDYNKDIEEYQRENTDTNLPF